jgi:hypothetical protein
MQVDIVSGPDRELADDAGGTLGTAAMVSFKC